MENVEGALKVPQVLFIGLNPSIANEKADDATVRKCVGFARRWHYSRMVLCNVFSRIATDPEDLPAYERRRTRHENMPLVIEQARRSELVVACWGDLGQSVTATDLLMALAAEGVDVHCLGRTRAGQPRHPSRLAYATPLEVLSYGRLARPQAVRAPLRLVR